MLICEKNQYSNSCYHPDSSSKTNFHVLKITKSAKIDKKGKSVENLGEVENAILGKYLYNSHFHYSQIISHLDGRANAYIIVSRLGLGGEL